MHDAHKTITQERSLLDAVLEVTESSILDGMEVRTTRTETVTTTTQTKTTTWKPLSKAERDATCRRVDWKTQDTPKPRRRICTCGDPACKVGPFLES